MHRAGSHSSLRCVSPPRGSKSTVKRKNGESGRIGSATSYAVLTDDQKFRRIAN
jgi:hypothetical protein